MYPYMAVYELTALSILPEIPMQIPITWLRLSCEGWVACVYLDNCAVTSTTRILQFVVVVFFGKIGLLFFSKWD